MDYKPKGQLISHILTIGILEALGVFLLGLAVGFDWSAFSGIFDSTSPIIRIALKLDGFRQLSYVDIFVITFCVIFLVSVSYLFTFRCIQNVLQWFTNHKNEVTGKGMTLRMFVSVLFAVATVIFLFTYLNFNDFIQSLLLGTFVLAFGFMMGCFWEWKSIRSVLD